MATIGKVACSARRFLSAFRNTGQCFSSFASTRNCSSAIAHDESSTDLYPPVKPRYPPGTWDKEYLEKEDGGVAQCWKLYEQGQELLKMPKVKDRLEHIAGTKEHWQFLVEPFEKIVANTQYKQFITKTHLVNSFTHLDDTVYTVDCEEEYKVLRPLLMDAIAQEYNYHYIHRIENGRLNDIYRPQLRSNFLLNQLVNMIIGYLGGTQEHLLFAQVDRYVRVQTFWQRTGFSDKEIKGKGKWNGKFNMQYKGDAACQVRTEFPVPAFLPLNDALCTANTYPKIDFGPAQCGQVAVVGRNTTVSGHWIGDPCEFCLLSVHQLPPIAAWQRAKLGDEVLEKQALMHGMMASFSSCVAQAYNQGFTRYHELTYPITTQAMVLDESGKEATFIAYQLNTMQLDKDDEANPLQNICWASQPMQLFETVADGEVKGFNDNVFKRLLKMFMVKLEEKGDHLRPYLPEDDSPSHQQLYINHVGQEPLPFRKPGRFEYPKNAVYY